MAGGLLLCTYIDHRGDSLLRLPGSLRLRPRDNHHAAFALAPILLRLNRMLPLQDSDPDKTNKDSDNGTINKASDDDNVNRASDDNTVSRTSDDDSVTGKVVEGPKPYQNSNPTPTLTLRFSPCISHP